MPSMWDVQYKNERTTKLLAADITLNDGPWGIEAVPAWPNRKLLG